jgi:hypothetical protein
MHRQRERVGISLYGPVVALCLITLGLRGSSQAATVACGAGDVACLIAAINAANTNGQANTITLEAGTYTLTAADNDTFGPNGLPSITSPLTITGAGAEATILERAASAPNFRVVHVAAAGALTLDGVTLRGGLSFSGGALHNSGGTVAITRSALTDNVIEFEGPGGGLFNNGGTVTIADSTLARNSAAAGNGAAGGGVYSDGGAVTLRNCALTGNHAGGGGGGLLIARGIGTITHTTIIGNQSGYFGGGLYTDSATVTITQSTLAGNNAGFTGGGLYATETSAVTLAQSAVNVNTASLSGGGLYIAGGSVVTITRSTVAGNQLHFGSDGGGLSADETSTVMITQSTLAHNATAASAPDGVTGRGGGLFSAGGPVALQNTILAGNSAATGPDCAGPVTSWGHNLIGTPTDCPMALLSSDVTGAPRFGEAIDDGTPGHGHLPLLPTSPAIDAGDDATCPPSDQLGQQRVKANPARLAVCDIGAIEFQPPGVDAVAIRQAIFVAPLAVLFVVATSSAAPDAELFVTVPDCLMQVPMSRIHDRYLRVRTVPECGDLDGQTATVTSSHGGSASAPLR